MTLTERQAALQRAMIRLEEGLADLQDLVERQGEMTERGLRASLRFHGMVRYDAYRDMGGAQSWSIALLDGNRTGSIITSLHARDHARVYLKEMVDGVAGQRLSPEEERAVELALQGPPVEAPPRPARRGRSPEEERALGEPAPGAAPAAATPPVTPPRTAAEPAAAEPAGDDEHQRTGEFPAVRDDEPPAR